MQKSWYFNRRTFLQGTGVALALPWLDCMAEAYDAVDLPARLAAVYFPFGVSLPSDKSEHADWNWFPKEEKEAQPDFSSCLLVDPFQEPTHTFCC